MTSGASPLELVLENIEKLNSKERAIVKNKVLSLLAVPEEVPTHKSFFEDKLFMIPFDVYSKFADDEQDEIQTLAYRGYRGWLNQELTRLQASWMLICGGKIIDASFELNDYPSHQRMKAVGKKLGFAPLVFVSDNI